MSDLSTIYFLEGNWSGAFRYNANNGKNGAHVQVRTQFIFADEELQAKTDYEGYSGSPPPHRSRLLFKGCDLGKWCVSKFMNPNIRKYELLFRRDFEDPPSESDEDHYIYNLNIYSDSSPRKIEIIVSLGKNLTVSGVLTKGGFSLLRNSLGRGKFLSRC